MALEGQNSRHETSMPRRVLSLSLIFVPKPRSRITPSYTCWNGKRWASLPFPDSSVPRSPTQCHLIRLQRYPWLYLRPDSQQFDDGGVDRLPDRTTSPQTNFVMAVLRRSISFLIILSRLLGVTPNSPPCFEILPWNPRACLTSDGESALPPWISPAGARGFSF